MRIVCLSDSHDIFRDLTVPEGDLLLHGGDLTRKGKRSEAEASAQWLRSLPHQHKVLIAGNHDFCLQQQNPREILAGLTYLEDESTEILGLRIFGSPWSPAHGLWAFQAERGEEIRRRWAAIPPQTDILITHGPPWGILDKHVSGIHLGCQDLAQRAAVVKPKLHLFGHVHESHGWTQGEHTLSVNACNCSFGYKRTQPAIVLDWDGRAFQVQNTPEPDQEVIDFEPWNRLVRAHGAPKEMRSLEPGKQTQAIESNQVFWLEVHSDQGGARSVRFRPYRADEDLTDRGPDFSLRQWAFTFGCPVPEQLEELNRNPWRRYTQVPHLPP